MLLPGAGADQAIAVLLARDPASRASLDDAQTVAELLRALHAAGASGAVTALANRAARPRQPRRPAGRRRVAASAARGCGARRGRCPGHPGRCLRSHRRPWEVSELLRALREAGADAAVTTLLARDLAENASLDDPRAVANLIQALREAGASGAATALAGRAAGYISLEPRVAPPRSCRH